MDRFSLTLHSGEIPPAGVEEASHSLFRTSRFTTTMSLAALSTARHEALIEFAALGQADHLPLGCYVWPTETFRTLIDEEQEGRGREDERSASASRVECCCTGGLRALMAQKVAQRLGRLPDVGRLARTHRQRHHRILRGY